MYFQVFTFCSRQNCGFALKSIFDVQFEFNVQFPSLYIFQQRKLFFFVKIYISGEIWLQRAVLSVNILQQPKLSLSKYNHFTSNLASMCIFKSNLSLMCNFQVYTSSSRENCFYFVKSTFLVKFGCNVQF